jgi:hypothetical protein
MSMDTYRSRRESLESELERARTEEAALLRVSKERANMHARSPLWIGGLGIALCFLFGVSILWKIEARHTSETTNRILAINEQARALEVDYVEQNLIQAKQAEVNKRAMGAQERLAHCKEVATFETERLWLRPPAPTDGQRIDP